MAKTTGFSGWGFEEKLTRIPDGINYYKGTLDLSRTSGIDMIPAALKGVHCVKMGLEEASLPNYYASLKFKAPSSEGPNCAFKAKN